VGRGERPIKLGDSWFSPKSILVGPLEMSAREVEHWMGPGTERGRAENGRDYEAVRRSKGLDRGLPRSRGRGAFPEL
jgi:hypothetical protein